MKNFMQKNEKGAILYLTIIIMAVISAMAIGMNVFFTSQIKMTKDISDSVKALCAADTGIERLLDMSINDIRDDPEDIIDGEGFITENDAFDEGNDYGYVAQIICCVVDPTGDCKLVLAEPGIVCPAGFDIDDDCKASYFCYKSTGNYKGIKRAIEIKR